IREKYGMESLNAEIKNSDEKLGGYKGRREKGEEIPEAIIYNENERKKGFIENRENLRKNIEAIKNLTISPPKILSVLSVVPKFNSQQPSDNIEAEKIGMEVAMRYERKEKRVPDDVSAQNLGYDVKSALKDEQEIRYIEVKARSPYGQIITMTTNEWLKARRFKEQYWLYIVVLDAGSRHKLYVLKDPASVIKPTEEVGVVTYNIDDWKNFASLVEN
ncbi:MAG: DUF3883 domain-containing protein, partial [Nitrosotalea sp.]